MRYLPFILYIFLLGCEEKLKEEKLKAPSPKMSSFLSNFVVEDCSKVSNAADSLELLGKESIPYLLELMNDEKRYVKLTNTADLIYPGATEFYGHGWVVDYDIDWIAIRAGWVLEGITFENFGFKENTITEADLLALHKEKYAEYVEKGKHEINFKKGKFKQLSTSIAKAKKWWNEHKQGWNRLQAIKDAIYSDDPQRQAEAIGFMRSGKKLEGLDGIYYEKELRSRIDELKKSDDELVAEQAKYFFLDY